MAPCSRKIGSPFPCPTAAETPPIQRPLEPKTDDVPSLGLRPPPPKRPDTYVPPKQAPSLIDEIPPRTLLPDVGAKPVRKPKPPLRVRPKPVPGHDRHPKPVLR